MSMLISQNHPGITIIMAKVNIMNKGPTFNQENL